MEINRDLDNNVEGEELTFEENKEVNSSTEETTKDDNQTEELMLKLTRMQADYSNLKRRTEIERKGAVDYGIETLAIELLPVLDNFERALDSEKDKEAGFYQGIVMIYNQFIDMLEKMDIKEIDDLNCPFDPNKHNAIMVEESEEHGEGIIIGILQKGYQFKDKVIRPAMVMVSK